ncbi:ABC transporter substrate-binding protein [Ancylobacter sp. MQZ15Z-1]|uniref:ABC transporter substrate-binding protein n=1 Tax=Ancylobacter mangrovi TaxID=2972472 RepID=A0A9X2PF09_9HYPH|nr:ABC transporter substrate-binding protein [Ancylobacter mangrovi]MCS0497517.1 ABC transporter substrate-binding protein [Ancylobacter mangrovi]
MIAALRLLLLVGLWILAGAGAPAAFAQPADSPAGPAPIRVGTFPDNKPWEFHDPSGALVGFEVDTIEAIAGEMGRQVVFVPMPFQELMPALEAGRIDVAMCSITLTAARLKTFDSTQPYYDTSQGIVVLKTSHIRALTDLKGKTVSVEPGTTNEQWLTRNAQHYGFGPIVPVQGLDAAVDMLHRRQVDAYFGDLPALLYRLLKAPDLAVVQRLPTDDRYGMLLARHSPLTAPLDAALSAIKKDGTMARIHERWFGSLPPPGSPVVKALPRP